MHINMHKHVTVVIIPDGPETAAKYRLVFPSIFNPIEVFNTLNKFFSEQKVKEKEPNIPELKIEEPKKEVNSSIEEPKKEVNSSIEEPKKTTIRESLVGLKNDPELIEYIAQQMFKNISDVNIKFLASTFNNELFSIAKISNTATGNVYRCLKNFGYIICVGNKSHHKIYQLTDKTKQLIGRTNEMNPKSPSNTPVSAASISSNVLYKDWKQEVIEIENEIHNLIAHRNALEVKLNQLQKTLELIRSLQELQRVK